MTRACCPPDNSALSVAGSMGACRTGAPGPAPANSAPMLRASAARDARRPGVVDERSVFAKALTLVVFGLAGCTSTPSGVDSAPSQPTGEAIFAQACARCHGTSGRGDGPLGPRNAPMPILGDASRPMPSPQEVWNVIRFGRGRMPAHRDRLTPQDADAVTAYVERRFFGREPAWPP
jgi:mono/diheme cytochrome c family protein